MWRAIAVMRSIEPHLQRKIYFRKKHASTWTFKTHNCCTLRLHFSSPPPKFSKWCKVSHSQVRKSTKLGLNLDFDCVQSEQHWWGLRHLSVGRTMLTIWHRWRLNILLLLVFTFLLQLVGLHMIVMACTTTRTRQRTRCSEKWKHHHHGKIADTNFNSLKCFNVLTLAVVTILVGSCSHVVYHMITVCASLMSKGRRNMKSINPKFVLCNSQNLNSFEKEPNQHKYINGYSAAMLTSCGCII